MALPGLDTDNISYIAFWNFLDNGASTIDPFETESAMESFTEYSNGVEGTYQFDGLNRSITFNVRAKSDGWLIAWLENDQTTGRNIQSVPPQGFIDVVNDWTTGNINPSQTTLERGINDLYTALSNSSTAAYNSSDVALYTYRTPNATNITFVGRKIGGDSSTNFTITPTAVTLYDGYAYGSARFAGSEVVLEPNSNDPLNYVNESSGDSSYFVRDAAGRGEIQSGSTTELRLRSNITAGARAACHFLITWA